MARHRGTPGVESRPARTSSLTEGSRVPDVLERSAERRETPVETDRLERQLAGSPSLTAERLARQDLRRQIATLEARLGRLFASAFPRQGIEWGVGAVGGPRVLDSGELERVRDALAARLRDAQRELGRRGAREEATRGLLESMIADPAAHPWVRISAKDVGERSCGEWHSRPRWGLLGMLIGWWRVKLSSGCPLAGGRAALCRVPVRFEVT
jgi:hypothetical protein